MFEKNRINKREFIIHPGAIDIFKLKIGPTKNLIKEWIKPILFNEIFTIEDFKNNKKFKVYYY